MKYRLLHDDDTEINSCYHQNDKANVFRITFMQFPNTTNLVGRTVELECEARTRVYFILIMIQTLLKCRCNLQLQKIAIISDIIHDFGFKFLSTSTIITMKMLL